MTISIAIGFVAVGSILAAFYCFRIYQAILSTRWPWVDGAIASAELREVVSKGPLEGVSAPSTFVNFSYYYRVGDRDYRGARVTYSDLAHKNRKTIESLLDEFQGKSWIPVYYNPKNPRQSVLVPGLSVFNLAPLVGCVLFVLFGLVSLG